MAKQTSRYKTSPLAVLQPRSRRETVFLVGVLIIATFLFVRIFQFRALTPRGNTITAVLSTTQVVRGKHGPDGDEEPTAVFTEVFIDSGSGEGFKRPRKQPDVQVKYDNQRKSTLQKPASDKLKGDQLPSTGKLTATDNQSLAQSNSAQRIPATDTQQRSSVLSKSDPQKAALPANFSKLELVSDSKPRQQQVKPVDTLPKQDRASERMSNDKLPIQKAQQVILPQKQADTGFSKQVLPELLDPKSVIITDAITQPLVQKSVKHSPPQLL